MSAFPRVYNVLLNPGTFQLVQSHSSNSSSKMEKSAERFSEWVSCRSREPKSQHRPLSVLGQVSEQHGMDLIEPHGAFLSLWLCAQNLIGRDFACGFLAGPTKMDGVPLGFLSNYRQKRTLGKKIHRFAGILVKSDAVSNPLESGVTGENEGLRAQRPSHAPAS